MIKKEMQNNKIFGLIMAGGAGTRFWPLSTQKTPKQLLNLTGKDCLINETILRLSSFIDFENIFIVTNKDQCSRIREKVKKLVPAENVIVEPAMKNTTACICLSALMISKKRGNGVMVVCPSDAYVDNYSSFKKTILEAKKCAERTDGLVTIGIKPNYPATGYGYILVSEKEPSGCYKVRGFVEKPNYEEATKLLDNSKCYWNSGIFVWKISSIIKELEEHIPQVFNEFKGINDFFGTAKINSALKKVYSRIQSISIDYSGMEKSKHIWMVEGAFDWTDIGTWESFSVFHEPDENGNVLIGDSLSLDSENCISLSTKKTIVTFGVKDLIVVEGEKAVFVLQKGQEQNIKRVIELLVKQKKEKLL